MADIIFAFVVLHYNEPKVTEKCVKAIRENTKKHSSEIVIVDNCSPDGSGGYLEKKYKDQPHITVLKAEKNLGFARGNNIGYTYAKQTLHADYICVMNNDVLLLQPDFIERIVQEYETSKCGIVGPHITLLNGYTNYMYLKIHTREYFEHELQMSKQMYRYYTSRLYPVRNIINRTLDKLLPALKFQKQPVKETLDDKIQMVVASKQRHKNIVLHGCCLIPHFDVSYSCTIRSILESLIQHLTTGHLCSVRKSFYICVAASMKLKRYMNRRLIFCIWRICLPMQHLRRTVNGRRLKTNARSIRYRFCWRN